MANKRIKDLTQTATTLASDDYVAIDGPSNGTRKIVKGDLVNDISSQVAGTYLDEANNLSDVASLDTSKLNLEVPDVGTAPNEVPLNGMLGDMAYQSSDGVSMGTVEADSLDVGGQSKAGSLVVYDANGNASNSLDVTYSGSSGVANIQADSSGGSTALTFGTSNAGVVGTRMTIDSSGRVGIGTASPGSYYTGTDDLVVAGASGDRGITIATPNTANGGLMFADSDSTTIGRIQYSHGTNEMKFRVNNTEVWSINSSGNLVANGTAIDFGSGASLSNYEEGTHTTTMTTTSSGTITLDSSADRLGYIIIGKHVAITGRLNVSAVSSPSGALVITLPTIPANLTEVAGSGGGCCAYYDNSAAVTWSNVPIVWDEGSSNLYIRIDASTVAASDEFRFSFVYRTT